MRKGGGKAKGSSFERQVCAALSLWITKGKAEDVFWRSAMSGGRATVHHRKGAPIRQSGDIAAVAPEGHAFTDKWFIECKHVRNLDLGSFLLSNTGNLAKFWKVACEQAHNHKKEPMLIAKQNHAPVIVLTRGNALTTKELDRQIQAQFTSHTRGCCIVLFDDLVFVPKKKVHRVRFMGV